jgi:hypothetical protein
MVTLRLSHKYVAGLALGLIAVLLLSACAAPPAVDVEATAQSLARLGITQTAEAQPAAQTQPSTGPPIPAATAPVPTEPPAPSATATLSAKPTATRAPSATAVATATSAPGAALTLTAAPPCAIAVNPQLTAGWDRGRLGCPTAKSSMIWSAWEPFQHGDMFWRSDLDWTYALHQQNGTDKSRGDWATGKDAWKWDQVSYPDGRGLKPPSGLFEPKRGFGFAWFDALGGSASPLGWATGEEKGFCANLQEFEKGLIIHSTGGACGDNLYNWANVPAFAPLFFTLNADGSWERH